MRNKRDQIVAELSKVDGKVTLDDAFDALKSFAEYQISHDHQTGCYDEVWENPQITALNKDSSSFYHLFFTLYELKGEYEVNSYRSAFKFIFGRIGDTKVVDIN